MATTYPKTEKKQSVADLAWEYSENKRKGQAVRMRDYLVKCRIASRGSPSRNWSTQTCCSIWWRKGMQGLDGCHFASICYATSKAISRRVWRFSGYVSPRSASSLMPAFFTFNLNHNGYLTAQKPPLKCHKLGFEICNFRHQNN